MRPSCMLDCKPRLVTTGVELTEGRQYSEVQLDHVNLCQINVSIGICKSNLLAGPTARCALKNESWFINCRAGTVRGTGSAERIVGGRAEGYREGVGDRVGMLLDPVCSLHVP
jgi:hypothetical protein